MLVIDIETTGVDYNRHSAISIGALEFENPSNAFYIEFKPWLGAEIDPEALDINGLNINNIVLTHNDGLSRFNEWVLELKERTPVGQNIGQFDMRFLFTSYNKAGFHWPFGHRVIDLHSIIYYENLKLRRKTPIDDSTRCSALSSKKIFEFAGLPPEPKPHNSLTGAKMVAEVMSRIIYGNILFEEFKKYGIPDYLKK